MMIKEKIYFTYKKHDSLYEINVLISWLMKMSDNGETDVAFDCFEDDVKLTCCRSIPKT